MSADFATIRAMRWWDLPDVLALEQELFSPEAWSEAQLWGELAQGTRRYVVAVDGGGSLLGYAGIDLGIDTADVQTLAVARPARRRGVARRLLGSLLTQAEQAGLRDVVLEVRADNEAAACLYAEAGFRPIGRRRGYYAAGTVDAVVLRRRGTRSPQQEAAGALAAPTVGCRLGD